MEKDCNNTGQAPVNNTKIKITNLYKIFGNNSKKYISSVRDGMSKDELLSKYNHVLGLDNINLNVEDVDVFFADGYCAHNVHDK